MANPQVENRALRVVGLYDQKGRNAGSKARRGEVVLDDLARGRLHDRAVGGLGRATVDGLDDERGGVVGDDLKKPFHALGGEGVDEGWIRAHGVGGFGIKLDGQRDGDSFKHQCDLGELLADRPRGLHRHGHFDEAARGNRLSRHVNGRAGACRRRLLDQHWAIERVDQFDGRGDQRPWLDDAKVNSRRISHDGAHRRGLCGGGWCRGDGARCC